MFTTLFAEAASPATEFADSPGFAAVFILGGMVLLFAELFLPGMIAGIAGGVLLLAGVALSFSAGGMIAGVFAVIAAVLFLVFEFWFYAKILPKTKVGKKIFLETAVEGAGADAPGDDSLIGVAGIAITAFAPSGLARVNDRQYDAVSRDGFLEKGDEIVVVARETLRLVVSKK